MVIFFRGVAQPPTSDSFECCSRMVTLQLFNILGQCSNVMQRVLLHQKEAAKNVRKHNEFLPACIIDDCCYLLPIIAPILLNMQTGDNE